MHHRSGHFYFSLKDEACSVKAVMFRGNAARLSFEPENGMSVVVRCRVSLYERDGAFQVYVEDLFPDGLGAAQMAFEQLKARLAKEGLFAPEIKKALPPFPRRISMEPVNAPSSALYRRLPLRSIRPTALQSMASSHICKYLSTLTAACISYLAAAVSYAAAQNRSRASLLSFSHKINCGLEQAF